MVISHDTAIRREIRKESAGNRHLAIDAIRRGRWSLCEL